MSLSSIPLLGIALIAYNLVVLVLGASAFLNTLVTIQLSSGDAWNVTGADVFTVASLGLLFFEVLRATSSNQAAVINHALSIAVFILGLLEFLLMQGFGNSTFFVLLVMLLLDVIAGFSITIVASRRDIGS